MTEPLEGRENKLEAIGMLMRLLDLHADMVKHPRTWSMDDGKKNRYYALYNKVERLLAKGIKAEAEAESLREVLGKV